MCRRSISVRVRSRIARSRRSPPRVSSRPAKMFAVTVRSGNASISWCTMPMPCASASRGRASAIGWPSRHSSPLSGRREPERILSSVDLPAPFSPTSACASPAATSKLTPPSARTAPNDLRTSRKDTAGALMRAHHRRNRRPRSPANTRRPRRGARLPGFVSRGAPIRAAAGSRRRGRCCEDSGRSTAVPAPRMTRHSGSCRSPRVPVNSVHPM